MPKSGIKKTKPGVMRVKGWRFNERRGIHDVTKRESCFGDKTGVTMRYDKK